VQFTRLSPGFHPRQALKDSHQKVPLGLDKKVDSISKTGDNVTVKLNGTVNYLLYKTQTNISFNVGSAGGKPAIVNIQGVQELHRSGIRLSYEPKTQYGPE